MNAMDDELPEWPVSIDSIKESGTLLDKSMLLRMPKDLYDVLKDDAKAIGVSVNKYVLMILTNALAHPKRFKVFDSTDWIDNIPDIESRMTKIINASYITSMGITAEQWYKSLVGAGLMAKRDIPKRYRKAFKWIDE